jgi:hypothetical protein
MIAIQPLPDVHAYGIEAKGITGIRIKKNGPVIKLLPKHNQRVGYGIVSLGHRLTSFKWLGLQTRDPHKYSTE